MRFFLVGTDRVSGTLRLIADATFESRRDALAHLSSDAAAAMLTGLDEEVFVVDLDAAAPVLLVHSEGQGAEDAPGEAGVEVPEDAGADDGWTEPEALEPAEADEAALSGETEIAGSAAEYPTPFVPEPASWPWDAAAEDATEDAEPEEPVAEEPAVEEPVAGVPYVGEPDYLLDPLEEPAVDDTSLLTPPEEGVAFRPVMMGEYAEAGEIPNASVDAAGDGEAEAEEPAAEDAETEPAEILIEEAPAAEVADLPVEPMSIRGADEDEASAGGTAGDEEVEEAAVIEMTQYACDDCVYVNTCPKHHESDPSSCGSFQWRIA